MVAVVSMTTLMDALRDKRQTEQVRKIAEAETFHRANQEKMERCHAAIFPILSWLEKQYGYEFGYIPGATYQVDETENENGRFHWLTLFFLGRGRVQLTLAFSANNYGYPVDSFDPTGKYWRATEAEYSSTFSDPLDAFEFLGLGQLEDA